MMGVAVFSGVAGALQLFVPSYAFRLVRRFGSHRVGWFLVSAFGCMALLHLMHLWVPVKPPPGLASAIPLDLMYALCSILLLIGMGHMETLFREREQAQLNEENLRNTWETQVIEETTEMARTNQDLLKRMNWRDQMEKALIESESQYRFLFNENPMPMWIFDLRTCRFLAVNQAALRQYGYTADEFMARSVRELLPADLVLDFLRDVSAPCAEPRAYGVWQNCTSDGTVIEVEMTAFDVKFAGNSARLIVANDISERWRREVKYRKGQKMEVMSQVAGGIAHQFAPVMGAIERHADFATRNPQDARTPEQMKHLTTAATRGTVLTRQLLAVGGQHPMRLEALDLNGLVRNLSRTVRRLAGPDLNIQNTYGSFVPAVLADQYLLEQIVVNLVLNARDAITGKGTLTISTSGVRIEKVQSDSDARIGQFVRLSVRDTGCGIPANVQSRLFEPFFTTKEAGKGTGLGLASVYGAVKQQGGWVEFLSEVGAGTEFRVFLPCAPASAPGAQAAPAKAAPKREAMGTVLLVEGDDRARGLARCVLDWNGYRVIEADCGSIALVLSESQASKIDLLVTDVQLPGDISGSDLAAKLLQLRPDLKVIYTSKCAPDHKGANLPVANTQFIPKPYTPEKLLHAVQEFLGQA
jgi:two-component system cell cycle sensor histidine kinase/response regulator CckA